MGSVKIRFPEPHLNAFLADKATNYAWGNHWKSLRKKPEPRSDCPSTWPAFEEWMLKFGPSFGRSKKRKAA